MGLLRKPDGTLLPLAARTLIGRAPTAGLRLDDRRVSGEHASIWFEGGWWVRDLGSSNGTWVGTRQLAAGERAALVRGETVAFGDVTSGFLLDDDGPPAPMARSADGDLHVGDSGLLALPDEATPQVSIYPRPEGWVAEGPDGLQSVEHGSIVVAGGQPFTLLLPSDIGGTWSATGTTWALPEATLVCEVSLDYESVHVALVGSPGTLDLGTRAHHLLLATLAAQRLADIERPEPEQGWLYLQELEARLGHGEHLINVHVHRARQQLTVAGVEGAAGLVERRAGTGQLRLGLRRVVLRGDMPS